MRCKGCRATLPLLKTRWLAKADRKRVLLTLMPRQDGTGVDFHIETDVPRADGTAVQRREHDKRLGAGTMSASGASCPCCPATMSMEDIRVEGAARRLGATPIAVVVSGPRGKEYRRPEDEEVGAAEVSDEEPEAFYREIPFNLPSEDICAERPSPNSRGASGLPKYGIAEWQDMFTGRQILTLGKLVRETRRLPEGMAGLPEDWREALQAFSALCVDRLADYSSAVCSWHNSGEKLRNTFSRFALPMVWDYTEVNPLSETSGGFSGALDWVARVVEHLQSAAHGSPIATVLHQSATDQSTGGFDVICTDPPLRRHSLLRHHGLLPCLASADLAGHFAGIRLRFRGSSRSQVGSVQELWRTGRSAESFRRRQGGIEAKLRRRDGAGVRRMPRGAPRRMDALVVVFANKSPDAWEIPRRRIDPGWLRGCGLLADSNGDAEQAGWRRKARILSLAGLPQASGGAAGLGYGGAGGDARTTSPAELREFWDAGIRGPGLRVGSDGTRAPSLLPSSRCKKGGRTRRVDDGLRLPA